MFKSKLSELKHNWIFNLVLAAALSIFGFAYLFSNQFDIYSTKRLFYLPLIIPFVFLFVSLIGNSVLYPVWNILSRKQKFQFLLTPFIFFVFFFWLKPLPMPDLEQDHHLVISATGEKTGISKNSLVEIRSIRYLNGRLPGTEQVSQTADWQISDLIFYSKGASDSRLEIKGKIPAGLVLELRYFNEGGRLKITWDGVSQDLDLYRPESTTAPLVLWGLNWFRLPFDQILIIFCLSLLYILGALISVLFGLLLLYRWLGKYFPKVIYGLFLASILVIFIIVKSDYLKIDLPRTFRDSTSYAEVADQALTSPSFWAGVRPFTLPLFLKVVGTTNENFRNLEQLERIAKYQLILSAVSWCLLALSFVIYIRPRWLGAVLYSFVLIFSLSPEISLWDSLLLSESISFSLFVLMLACWIALISGPTYQKLRWLNWVWVVCGLTIAILFAFVRDSNVYFALAGAVFLVFVSLIHRQLKHLRFKTCAYAIGVVLILLVQNVSLSGGDRWQIFIYDHLAMRILRDPSAVQFFKDEGLPVNEILLKTTQMVGFEYQKLFTEDASMQPVRDWVNCCGKSAYIKYLISRPWQTLMEPVNNASRLLNGDNLEYRHPRYEVRPLPEHLAVLNALFFNHQIWLLIILGLAALSGGIKYWIKGGIPVWNVILILTLSVYPMMFLIWHGEPLEIERHAAQIGIQFRLAGWAALIMLLMEIDPWLKKILKFENDQKVSVKKI